MADTDSNTPTVVGPMVDHLNSVMKDAHDAHLAELKNGGWPSPTAYKEAMRKAKNAAIASFTGQAPAE